MNNYTDGDFREEEVSLSDYIQVISRNRWIILLSFIVVVASTVYFTFTTPPTYEAQTLVMITNKPSSAESFFAPIFGPTQMYEINNQVEILKSRTLAYNVIKSLMNSPYVDSLYILGTKEMKPSAFSKLMAGLKSLISFGEEEETAAEDTLYREYVKNLQNSMEVEPKRDTEAIYIRVQSPDPFEAALIANTIAQEYYNQDLSYTRTEVVEVKNFIEEQLKKIEADLAKAEKALQDYQEREQVFGLTETAQTLIDQLSTFEATYYTATAEVKVTENKINSLKQQLNEREKALLQQIVNTNNPYIMELRQKIAQLEAEKVEAITTQGYKETDPGIIEYTKRIDELKNQLVEATRNLTGFMIEPSEQATLSADLIKQVIILDAELVALRAKADEYKKLVDQYNQKLNQLPAKSLEYARLDRERQVNEKYFMLMKTKLQESKIAEASRISNVRIVDYAIPPEKPIKPKKKLNLILGIFIGLGLGVGIAFMREYMDNSVRTGEDLEKMGLTVIGLISRINVKTALDEKLKKQKKGEEVMKARLITHYDPKSPVAESYRTLRTNVTFSKPDQPIHTLAVSSPGPGDGKSTTISNLAITFANLGKKTLLVDTDLRRPVLHKLFNLDRKKGLTSIILKEEAIDDVIQTTKIENLDVLTAGQLPPNPSELLGSMKMYRLIQELKERYEMILFDSPPLLAVTDATVLGRNLDGLMLVVYSGKTDKQAVQHAIQVLKSVHVTLIGVVLNNIEVKRTYGSYYYYYYYYYYYGDGEKRRRKKRKRRKRSSRRKKLLIK